MAIKFFARYWFLPFSILLAVSVSQMLGQDANWDLRNYHYYNPHAWLTGRLNFDIAPAQLQSYFNPISDIPYYMMVKADYPSWLVGAILAIPTAAALFFIGLISQIVLPASTGRLPVALILILSISGASGFSVIGSTQSEWHLTALFSASLWMLLKRLKDGNIYKNEFFSYYFFAGILAGIGVGLKLTGAIYAIGLSCMCFFMLGNLIGRLKNTLIFGLGCLLGFFILFSPWAFELWTRFNNPFFPFYNHIFKSPMAELISYADTRYAAKSIGDLVSLPFRLMFENVSMVSEMKLRDCRLAIGLPSLAILAFAPGRFSTDQHTIWRPIFVFTIVAYLSWASLSSIYRYAEMLELMMPLAIIALTLKIFQRSQNKYILAITLIIIGFTRCPDLGRLPHGQNAVLSTIPELPPSSMIVIATLEPIAYVIPSLPPEIPVVSLVNNFMRPGEWRTQLQIKATDRAMSHEGPLWLLTKKSSLEEKYYEGTPIKDMLKEIGLWSTSNCKTIKSGLDGDNLSLCQINKYP